MSNSDVCLGGHAKSDRMLNIYITIEYATFKKVAYGYKPATKARGITPSSDT